MKCLPYILLIICCNFCFCNNLKITQDSLSKRPSDLLKDQDEFFNNYKDSKRTSSIFKSTHRWASLDSIATLKEYEAYTEGLDNDIMNYHHTQRVFKWQLISSKLIFVTVIVLVLAGILFSGLQFKKGIDDSRTELEFSKNGIKVSSSILGVIVLVISLLFFYLYLVYVYPIQIVS